MPLLKREPEIWPPHLFGEPHLPGEAHLFREPNGNGHGHPHPSGDGLAGGGPQWWVAYTMARQEKALARHLLHWQVAYYLPQCEHRLRAGDRWRRSYVPLFGGYVFFRGDLHDRLTALRSNLVVRLIEAPEPDELAAQLRSLWLLQTTGAPLVPHPYLGRGDEVEIVDGPLRGYQGVVERVKGKHRLVVNVTLLRQSVAAEVGRDVLVPAAISRAAARRPATPPVRGAASGYLRT